MSESTGQPVKIISLELEASLDDGVRMAVTIWLTSCFAVWKPLVRASCVPMNFLNSLCRLHAEGMKVAHNMICCGHFFLSLFQIVQLQLTGLQEKGSFSSKSERREIRNINLKSCNQRVEDTRRIQDLVRTGRMSKTEPTRCTRVFYWNKKQILSIVTPFLDFKGNQSKNTSFAK